MRTTLDLDEDVLLAAYGLAQQRGTTIGKVLSKLARQTLTYSDLAEQAAAQPNIPHPVTSCNHSQSTPVPNEAR